MSGAALPPSTGAAAVVSAPMLRRRNQPRDPLAAVDPAAVSPRFAASVAGALGARRRYAEVLAGVRAGTVRDQLVASGARLDAGDVAVWEIA